eukprot:2823636-Pleurochrysis_carterae.AAC.1
MHTVADPTELRGRIEPVMQASLFAVPWHVARACKLAWLNLYAVLVRGRGQLILVLELESSLRIILFCLCLHIGASRAQALDGSLMRFADFFVAPLFTASATQREVRLPAVRLTLPFAPLSLPLALSLCLPLALSLCPPLALSHCPSLALSLSLPLALSLCSPFALSLGVPLARSCCLTCSLALALALATALALCRLASR